MFRYVVFDAGDALSHRVAEANLVLDAHGLATFDAGEVADNALAAFERRLATEERYTDSPLSTQLREKNLLLGLRPVKPLSPSYGVPGWRCQVWQSWQRLGTFSVRSLA